MAAKEAREEFLTDDREIPGQHYVLLSFLSPESVLAKKELYFFKKFLDNYEIHWRTKNLEAFLAGQVNNFNAKLDLEVNRLEAADQSAAAEICRASRVRVDDMLGAYQEYLKKNAKELTDAKLKEAYEDFLYAQSTKLEDEFYAKNEFRTSVRGLKVRGSYGSAEEATARAKKLQQQDGLHNIFVGEVGKWLPWDPSPNQVKEQEYAEDQLNTLMKAYKENEEAREQFYSKNPEAKREAFTGKKQVVTMGVTDEAEARSGVGVAPSTASSASSASSSAPSTGGGAGGAYDAIFNGHPDLALQRKMEREAAALKK